MAKKRKDGPLHDYTNPTYVSWKKMKQRCKNPNDGKYRYYGGRGIDYDPRWESFDAFFEDMGKRPDGLTLDRIDSNKGYSKDNCRWATRAEQAGNKRNKSVSLTDKQVRIVKCIGGNITQREIGEIFGVHQSEISRILNNKRRYHLGD